tara:strand:+ start:224 stop:601 length:378 start_codon:yes stop_codon:yes gene_type:complete
MANGMGFGADDAQDGSYGGDFGGGGSDSGSILDALKAAYNLYGPQVKNAWSANLLGNKASMAPLGPIDINRQREMNRYAAMMGQGGFGVPAKVASGLGGLSFDAQARQAGFGHGLGSNQWSGSDK